ncbi:unnamed protein product [Auanema sp. JU1783]|nr:unnamed protein product [Auanema sp. JU1783]
MITRLLLLSIFPLFLAQHFVPTERDYTTISPPIARPHRDFITGRRRSHHIARHPSSSSRRHEPSADEAAYLRKLEAYEEQRERFDELKRTSRDRYYEDYFNRMRTYAVETQIRKYNQLLQQQAAERARFAKIMNEYGVREEDVISQLGSGAQYIPREPEDVVKPPTNPFGDGKNVGDIMGSESKKPRVEAVPVLEPQPPSNIEPRPENRDVHRKAIALETLCAKFLNTVRQHCNGNKTEEAYVKKCEGYFKDCGGMIPKADPLYSIANSFSSGVNINVATVGVKGIPYYPINEEGAIEVGREIGVPFGSWGGGFTDHAGVRDYWSQTTEIGANWYEGKYGYKSGWSVPLVQSLGIEGDTHAVVSVPLKPGELGKPVGVDVGGGVGPYYQQNQHVGVDYMNGNVGTNFGVGVPFAGVGVNTGLGIKFPSVNDVIGK